jgi:hypothetical protein
MGIVSMMGVSVMSGPLLYCGGFSGTDQPEYRRG